MIQDRHVDAKEKEVVMWLLEQGIGDVGVSDTELQLNPKLISQKWRIEVRVVVHGFV